MVKGYDPRGKSFSQYIGFDLIGSTHQGLGVQVMLPAKKMDPSKASYFHGPLLIYAF